MFTLKRKMRTSRCTKYLKKFTSELVKNSKFKVTTYMNQLITMPLYEMQKLKSISSTTKRKSIDTLW
jgi:hypothetical protein